MGGSGWRDVVKDSVAAKAAETVSKNRGASNVARLSRVGISVAAHVYLVRAAWKRGISIAGYIRRATMAFVAMDLGLNPVDLFELDIAITPIGRTGAPPSKDLDGKLYGRWEIKPDEPRDPGPGAD